MAEEQQFYRQYLQSTAPDGSQTIREVVSPTLLDHDAAAAAEQQAGHTFTGFISPDKMPPAQPAPPTPPPAAPAVSAVPASGPPPTTQRWTPSGQEVAVPSPGATPWLNMIPPAMAVAGPLALSIAQPEIGLPLWLLSATSAGLGMGGGEAIREKLAGEEISPANIAEQGALGAATDVGMGVLTKFAAPVVKYAAGRLFPTLTAVEQAGPVLATGGQAAETAAPRVSDLASQAAKGVRASTDQAFDAARSAGQGLQVSTAGLDPHVAAATDAVTRAGATPEQVAQFNSVVRPLTGGAPADYRQLMSTQRQVENWVSGMRSNGVAASEIAPVEQLHQALGGQLDAAAAGTPAAPMHAQYVSAQGQQLPTRYALSSVAGDATNLAAETPATIQAIAKQASEAERPALAAAWVDSARRSAAQSANPVTAMRAQYEALGSETQTALFGSHKAAFEDVLRAGDISLGRAALPGVAGTAATAAKYAGLPHVPGLGYTVAAGDLMAPFVARQALVSPRFAAFGGGLSRTMGVAAPAAARLGGQSYAERAWQAGLPSF